MNVSALIPSFQLEMAGLGNLTGTVGMAGLVTPTFTSGGPIGLGGPPAPGSPVGKTGLPATPTGLTGFSQMQHHVRCFSSYPDPPPLCMFIPHVY